MHRRVSYLPYVIILIMVFTLTGCGAAQTTSGQVSIKMAGSGTISNITKEIAKVYMEKNKDVNIVVEQTSSGEGIKAAGDGSIDIGMTSRALTEDEEKTGLIEHVIAYDALGVIVNRNNPVAELSLDQLKGIYEGKIKNWKEVGGKDAPIAAGTRAEGMGSRSTIDDVLKISKEDSSLKIIENNDDVLPYVLKDENAIAYISMGYLNDSVNILKLGGAIPSVNAVKSREYKLSRNLYLVTKKDMKPDVEQFIEFTMTDSGQKVVFNQGYITIRKSRK